MQHYINNSILFILLSTLSLSISAQIVRMETVLGNIDIELHPEAAPNTVINFLKYVNDGDYDGSYVHRSVRNFIIQGGGFTFIDGESGAVPADSPIDNEFNLSNIRGTIAMAKVAGNPDSATSQWFFNTRDNSSNLDNQNGGFTVFGTVIAGMDVVDSIAALEIWNVGGALTNLPLVNYSGAGIIENELVMLPNVFVLDEDLNINSGLNGGWYNQATSGQGILIEILPASNLAFMAWFTYDTQDPVDDVVSTIGYAGHRWLTGLGAIDYDNKSITFDLVSTAGGLFDDPQDVENSEAGAYGSFTINFTDCLNATVTYELTAQDLSGSFPMTRISADNVALCESLSREAN